MKNNCNHDNSNENDIWYKWNNSANITHYSQSIHIIAIASIWCHNLRSRIPSINDILLPNLFTRYLPINPVHPNMVTLRLDTEDLPPLFCLNPLAPLL